MIKLLVLVVVVAVVGVGGHDAYEILNARRNLSTTATAAGDAAVAALHKNAKDPTGGHAAADAAAAAGHAVVTAYNFSPAADKITLTVSTDASTWVVGRVDSKLANNISASRTAHP